MSWMERKGPYPWVMDVRIMEKPLRLVELGTTRPSVCIRGLLMD